MISSTVTTFSCGESFLLPNYFDLLPSDILILHVRVAHPAHRIFVFDPAAARPAIARHCVEGNKLLMRRFYVVEKLKEAEVIGVVMGTLGMAKYASAMRRALSLIAAAKKKSYTLVVGKVNVPKLCNFMEIDAYVLIADGETALALSGAAQSIAPRASAPASAPATAALDLDKPIATLFELELALSPERSWDGTYIADFRHIVSLAEGVEGGDAGSLGEGDGAAATAAQAKATRPDAKDGTLVAFGKREVGKAFSSPAATFLAEREWQGIEVSLFY